MLQYNVYLNKLFYYLNSYRGLYQKLNTQNT